MSLPYPHFLIPTYILTYLSENKVLGPALPIVICNFEDFINRYDKTWAVGRQLKVGGGCPALQFGGYLTKMMILVEST